MRNLLFHRSWVLATTSAAVLALAACGGGTENSESSASLAPQSASPASDTPARAAAVDPTAMEDVLAADAGAARQEPR